MGVAREGAEKLVDDGGVEPHGDALGELLIEALAARMEDIEVVLERHLARVINGRPDRRYDPASLLLHAETLDERVPALR